MSYIGKEPQTGAYSMLDALTASATASYSLTLDSTAFVPESANHLLVSLNGSIQKAGSSYTVSGSTLTFSSTLASSDSIDFVLALGNVLDIGTPSDATVTNAKTNFVSTSSAAGLQIKGDGTTDGTLQLNCSQNSHGVKIKSPAHSASQSYTLTLPTTSPATDKIMQTDSSGNLSFVDAPSGGLVYVGGATHTSDVSNVTIDNVFTATYRNYLIIGDYTSADNNVEPIFKFRSGGSSGSTLSGAEYNYHFIRMNADSDSLNNHRSQSNTYCSMGANVNNDSTRTSMRFAWTVFDPYTSSVRTSISGTGRMTATDGNSAFLTGSCDYKGSDSVTGMIFYFSSGNLSPAHFKVYGIVNS